MSGSRFKALVRPSRTTKWSSTTSSRILCDFEAGLLELMMSWVWRVAAAEASAYARAGVSLPQPAAVHRVAPMCLIPADSSLVDPHLVSPLAPAFRAGQNARRSQG